MWELVINSLTLVIGFVNFLVFFSWFGDHVWWKIAKHPLLWLGGGMMVSLVRCGGGIGW